LQEYETAEEPPVGSQGRHYISPPVPVAESQLSLSSFGADLRFSFLGTKEDRQKSLFVVSMLSLILAFFVVSAFSILLDMALGVGVVSIGLYRVVRWTKRFLNA
jgi:hypothetical protein